MRTSKLVAGAAFAILCAAGAQAQGLPLSVVEVKAPGINCVFDPSCSVAVDDAASPVGQGFLQTRVLAGAAGAPAGEGYGYAYRLALGPAAAGEEALAKLCFTEVQIAMKGAPGAYDFNGDGKPEEVFVVAEGGEGQVGVAAAERYADRIVFTLAAPLCHRTDGAVASTHFFGIASLAVPVEVDAWLGRAGEGGVAELMPRRARSPG